MKNQRGFAPILAVIVLLIALALIAGARYLVKNKTEAPAPVVATSTAFLQDEEVLVNLILNSNGFQDGKKHASVPNPDGPLAESISKDQIVFGDLNNDGKAEAVAPNRYCAASCGLGVSLFTFEQDNVTMTPVPGVALAGYRKDIKDIKIEKGILSVTQTYDGETWWTDQFRMINGELVKI
ncbi:MAG: hypothetical protein HYT48_03100 [Candidatus Vogelbacteria bacterium]|nr:hypothetical protein [Candidatus Vogelbacteria bacterium]